MDFIKNVSSLASELWLSKERQWIVSFTNPVEIWRDNPTYLMLEIVMYLWAGLVYRHGRWRNGDQGA